MAVVTEMVQVAAQVERSIKEDLQALADTNGRKLSAEVRLALRAHVDAESRPSDLRGAA